jgi:hypothetical protein
VSIADSDSLQCHIPVMWLDSHQLVCVVSKLAWKPLEYAIKAHLKKENSCRAQVFARALFSVNCSFQVDWVSRIQVYASFSFVNCEIPSPWFITIKQ